MKIRLLLFVVFMSCNLIYAQQNDCKVLLPSISGTYTGGCKKGLANGQGKAQGIDSYEGHFSKGLPSGTGTYTWSDGSQFVGQWENGMREGKGKMISRDSVTTGYWRNDKYVGTELIPPYKVTHNISVSRYTFKKTLGSEPVIKIRIMQGGTDNVDIESFTLAYSSGDEYRSANIYAIQNVKFPVNVKVTYTTWNQLHQSKFNVSFDFTINEPGPWDVTLIN